MKKYLVFILLSLASLSAKADYTLPLSGLQDLWSTSVSGSTITFSNWGGAGWWLDGMNCSAYNSVVVKFNSANQGGNLQVYYAGENNPDVKVMFGVGATQVSADLNASKKHAVDKIVISCESGSLTITSAYLSGSGTGGGGGGEVTPPVGTHGFIVSGTKLLDAKNNEFVMRGTNLALAWYHQYGYTRQIAKMSEKGANAVRVALGAGLQYSKVPAVMLTDIISCCEQNNMVLVVEVHDVTGSDDIENLKTMANYWVDMASALKGHEHTVIINIANEWGGKWDSNNWEKGYKAAIKIIRDAGLKHCLMVDSDGWGQHTATVPSYGSNVLNADPEKNIIFSIHMYGSAGKSGEVDSNIQNVLNQNLCLCIGEFGWYHSDGDVDEDAIIRKCKDSKVGWCSWSWWGNGGKVGYLDMVSDQYNGTPASQTANGQQCNWGQKIYDAWKDDGKTCTVYTGEPYKPDPQPTHLNLINQDNNTTKLYRNGQVYIVRKRVLYDLFGHAVEQL